MLNTNFHEKQQKVQSKQQLIIGKHSSTKRAGVGELNLWVGNDALR